jgi:hypothetical protein
MTHSEIIDALGGTSKVAELCEVTTGAVSQWRDDVIPRARLLFFKAIRPDLFQDQEQPKAA